MQKKRILRNFLDLLFIPNRQNCSIRVPGSTDVAILMEKNYMFRVHVPFKKKNNIPW